MIFNLFVTDILPYLLTNWLAYLYGRIQSPRPDVMPDRREGITRAAGFGQKPKITVNTALAQLIRLQPG